jgi:hypothetical protein
MKFKFRGPNTDQSALCVGRKSMKSKENSLRLSAKGIARTVFTVAGIWDKLGHYGSMHQRKPE